MNGWAIKDGNGEIDIGSLQGTFEDAWDEWLQGRQITTQKGAEAEGYTCVYVVIQEAGSGEAVAWTSQLHLDALQRAREQKIAGTGVMVSQPASIAPIALYASPPASAGMVSNEALNIAQAVVKTVDVDGLGKYTHPDQAHLVLFARELLRLAAAKGRP
jgi:hypothetical protein